MANIQPGVKFNVTTLDGERIVNMTQTRFTGYDTTVCFESACGVVVPLTAVLRMEKVR